MVIVTLNTPNMYAGTDNTAACPECCHLWTVLTNFYVKYHPSNQQFELWILLQQHWLISKYRQYICDYSLLALCHFILLWMCFHQLPNALPPQTQHNFWNGLEALAPASKLMQKCCLPSQKRLFYVMEGCFLLSTLYQWRTSENHRGHLRYNSWWMSGTTGIPFEHSCPQRLGNEG